MHEELDMAETFYPPVTTEKTIDELADESILLSATITGINTTFETDCLNLKGDRETILNAVSEAVKIDLGAVKKIYFYCGFESDPGAGESITVELQSSSDDVTYVTEQTITSSDAPELLSFKITIRTRYLKIIVTDVVGTVGVRINYMGAWLT
jgi:hypothetical protein